MDIERGNKYISGTTFSINNARAWKFPIQMYLSTKLCMSKVKYDNNCTFKTVLDI